MTIEERLERLAERHEALTQSVEMLLAAVRTDAENIRALARIADMHDRRITRLEEREQDGGR